MWYANLERNTRLGTLLVKRGLLTAQQLHGAVALQREHPERTLGDILVSEGLVTRKQLCRSLRRQARIRCVAALLAMLFAPLQGVSAGGLPSASASAERVAYTSAQEYAESPQLKLHDPGTDPTDRVDAASPTKAAQILARMLLRSMWQDPTVDTLKVADEQSIKVSSRYSLKLSNSKMMVQMKYRF